MIENNIENNKSNEENKNKPHHHRKSRKSIPSLQNEVNYPSYSGESGSEDMGMSEDQEENVHDEENHPQEQFKNQIEIEPLKKSKDFEKEKSLNQPNVTKPNEVKKEKAKPPAWKLKIRAMLDHWTSQTFMTTLTVYILFADDIKMICTDSSSDDIFSSLCVAIMALFSVEFMISSVVVEDYFLGFYFWLDFVSIISMLLDVHWFYDFLITSISGGATGGKTNVKSISAIAKAGRGAKVGSRAIRILRILRIIRLVRISKLYKASEKLIEDKLNKESKMKAQNVEKNKASKNNNNNEEEPQENIPQESKVGKKLSDLTTKRVIILVLSMMIGIILFNSSFYLSQLTSMDFGIKIFKEFSDINDPNFNFTFDIYVAEHQNISSPIMYSQVGNLKYGNFNDTSSLRDAEQIISSEDCENLIPGDETNSICIAIFDNRVSSRLASILNIIKTIFICIVLSGGAICFSKDTSEMVLEPIESMIQKIKEISKNPIEAMQKNEKEEFAKSLLEKEDKDKALCNCFGGNDKKHKKKKEAPLETVVLENTISKIGALLALGFGEAGSEIIAQNMQNNANGDVNPILPGKKVLAIYGFCDIRNFTDTTEVLQEKVMIFVNEIAEIVHEITAEHCGSANKNIGDAFLLVWKFEDKFVETDSEGNIKLINTASVNQICDMALISFLKILAKVHKSHKLDKYRKNDGLNKRIKNYCVKMGFGLHLGWSIEGAIGSTFKIDASYLSPHVNTASKLEEKTKEYGVALVISGEFISYCSEDTKRAARIIDKCIGDAGEEETVYTVDIDLNALKIEDKDPHDELMKGDVDMNNKQISMNIANAISAKKLEKYEKRMKRKKNYDDAVNCVRKFWSEFEENEEDYYIMRKKFKKDFYDNYYEGFNNFQTGDWMKAKASFEKAEYVLGDKDGPTQNLLHIMKENNFQPPPDWKGNRLETGH